MSIVSLTLLGIRSFRRPKTIPFAVPNGQPGSGLTVLVGPNGAGKSTIVEAFQFLSRMDAPAAPPFGEGIRNSGAGGRISIEFKGESGRRALLATDAKKGGDPTWREKSLRLAEGQVFVV